MPEAVVNGSGSEDFFVLDEDLVFELTVSHNFHNCFIGSEERLDAAEIWTQWG